MTHGWSQEELNRCPIPDKRPWKLRAAIVLGLMLWFWYEVGEYAMRWMR